jgi:two-component system, chemotaxis family, chemotaxis protein CheY
MDKKIMIVDDSITIRQTLGLMLKTAGYDVVDAKDGNDAWSKLPAEKVGLFILDVNMPGMDGIAFLNKLKTEDSLKHTPVLMLTTESSAEKIAEGKQAGAKAWMVKPFQPAQLLEAVKKLMVIR